ncbi:SDR family NAD(P)-dependent oxidoreductase [Apibacter muscae]|uniref:SDR family NAD(P)-dependent oxidoreductase n=1 Tax=Apibacter muscae TaxID=2509004 RepID=UPI0011AE0304|nr:SDR family NAD(P)-dependent oxidoreductase [Apibacter muscae]TWP31273.1 SDR family NAD(P)-dependent oxidoreductase [Apibacter muscae]
MIILGTTSDISQAFIDKFLFENSTKYKKIYLVTSNEEETKRFAQHILVKFKQESEIISFDLMKDIDYSVFNHIDSDLLFCASGYLGKNTEDGLYNLSNTKQIININYAKLVPLINYFAQKFEQNNNGTIIGLSSVAGLRGRQSNFIYGSAKAGFLTYLDGLRNYLYSKNVHVMSVIPGFMDTKMTAGMPLPKPLTATPSKAASIIYKAYKKKKNKIYVTSIWWAIMTIIKNIPEFIFKKLKM